MDREHAAALIGAGSGEALYALDERARVIRERIHPELTEPIAIVRGLIAHRIAPSLLPVVVRRFRLKADGVVQVVANECPEAAGIRRMAARLSR